MGLRGRPVMRASVPPYAATWLLKQVPESAWEAAAATLRGYGREEQAADLEEGFRQLRGARDLVSWTGGDAFDVVSVVSAASQTGAVSGSDEITTREAADMLRVQPARVRQLVTGGTLTGRAVNARLTMIPRAEVLALVEARQSA